MFPSEEEKQKALKELNESIKRFNENYDVNADVSAYDNATSKKNANAIFISEFKKILKQAIQNEGVNKNIRIVSMRAAYERDVIGPYRKYCIDGASERELAKVKRNLPEVDAGLNTDEWWRQLGKSLDDIYWEKIDLVVNNYKNGSPRIRDMVANTKRILANGRDINNDDIRLVASYAAALKRANESRRGFWRLLNYFRGNAELRESANIEKMLNERLGDPNAYSNALKEMTDPNGKIGLLKKESEVNRGLKLNFSAVTKEKPKEEKKEKRNEPDFSEKEQVIVEETEIISKSNEEAVVPGNERLYSLIKNKSFEEKIKDEIWKALKLKESITLDKKTVTDEIYKPLLESVKDINEGHFNLVNDGADSKTLEQNLKDAIIPLYSDAYLKLKNFNFKPVDHIVAAQKITNVMLNSLTVVGFENETFGKFGDNYVVNNQTEEVIELLQFQNPNSSEEANQLTVDHAKKELNAVQKQRVDISDSQKDVPVSAKTEFKSAPNKMLSK